MTEIHRPQYPLKFHAKTVDAVTAALFSLRNCETCRMEALKLALHLTSHLRGHRGVYLRLFLMSSPKSCRTHRG